MTTFEQSPHDRLTRRCIHCGTPRHSHAEGTLECPQRYRPGTLEEAERELRQALDRNDQHRIFVARGEVQRLGGDPDKVVPVAYTAATADDWVATDRPERKP